MSQFYREKIDQNCEGNDNSFGLNFTIYAPSLIQIYAPTRQVHHPSVCSSFATGQMAWTSEVSPIWSYPGTAGQHICMSIAIGISAVLMSSPQERRRGGLDRGSYQFHGRRYWCSSSQVEAFPYGEGEPVSMRDLTKQIALFSMVDNKGQRWWSITQWPACPSVLGG
jgi:hypothetical protein